MDKLCLLLAVAVCQVAYFTSTTVFARSLAGDGLTSTSIEAASTTFSPSIVSLSVKPQAFIKPRPFTKPHLFTNTRTAAPTATHITSTPNALTSVRPTDITHGDTNFTETRSTAHAQGRQRSHLNEEQQQPYSRHHSTNPPTPSSSSVSSPALSSSQSSLLIEKISPSTTLGQQSSSPWQHTITQPLVEIETIQKYYLPSSVFPFSSWVSREELQDKIAFLLETLSLMGRSSTKEEGKSTTPTPDSKPLGQSDDTEKHDDVDVDAIGKNDKDNDNHDDDDNDGDDDDDDDHDSNVENRKHHRGGRRLSVDNGNDDNNDDDGTNTHHRHNDYDNKNVQPTSTASSLTQTLKAEMDKMTVTQLIQVYALIEKAVKSGPNSHGQVVIGHIHISITKITTIKVSDLCCLQ